MDERVPFELARGPFTRARGVAAIGAAALRRGDFAAVTRGVYWWADEEVRHHTLVQAYREVLPPGAVLGGWSAAWAHRLCWADAGTPVEVVLPARARVRPRATLMVRADALLPDEVVRTWLGPTTSSARTAFDLARRPDPRPGAPLRPAPSPGPGAGRDRTGPADRGGSGQPRGDRSGSEGRAGARPGGREPGAPGGPVWPVGPVWPGRSGGPDLVGEAVAAVDALLRQTGCTVQEVLELAARHPGSRGCRRAVAVLRLVDPRAESPKESELRVLLVRAGLPAPTPQVEVHDEDGRFVARLDLAWPELKVAIEYDGAHHREAGQHSRDLRRHNALRQLGWRVMQVDAHQLADPERLVSDVARLLASVTR